jgi:two-component system response regulator AtoC
VNVDTEVNRGLKTILFVDDEKEARRTFSEVLSDMGYNVIDKPDGLSALSLIRQGVPIDLVITDYRMPDMNGLDLVMTLRKILPSIPVIMMTAHGDIENYFLSLSLGVFEYVNKPIGKREFEQLVKAALHEPEAA